MKGNFIRYSKGGMLLDLENQKHHYQVLRKPRKSMQINEQSSRLIHTSQTSRQQKIINNLIVIENQRLIKALKTIRDGKGVMGQMTQNCKQIRKYRKSLEHTIQYLKSQRKKQLRQGNQRLVNKIGYVQPKIGSNSEWDKHHVNNEKQKRKISRATYHVFDAEPLLNETFTTFNSTIKKPADLFSIKKQKVSNKSEQKSKRETRRRKKKFQEEQGNDANQNVQQIKQQQSVKSPNNIDKKKKISMEQEKRMLKQSAGSYQNIDAFKNQLQVF